MAVSLHGGPTPRQQRFALNGRTVSVAVDTVSRSALCVSKAGLDQYVHGLHQQVQLSIR
jgi:hypothetical protein